MNRRLILSHTPPSLGRAAAGLGSAVPSVRWWLASTGVKSRPPLTPTPPRLVGSRRTFTSTANRRQHEGGSSYESNTTTEGTHQQLSRQNAAWQRKALIGRSFLLIGATVGVLMLLESDLPDVDQTLLEWRYGQPLNERSFVPFTIVSKEVVSPTAFIITIQPKFLSSSSSSSSSSGSLPRFLSESHSHGSVLRKAWDHGLWSVEIKQPQLQVAREYTPLPPLPHAILPHQSGGGIEVGSVEEDVKDGRVRFLIRRMDGGEVSTYLSTLQPGDTVELRGPHLGFDVRKRLGSEGRLVFLAGGTGIAPALQAVHALFNTEGQTGKVIERGVKEKRVDISWANRHRADCIGCPPNRDDNVGPIVGWLEMMRNKYGEGLEYRCTVDEEGEFITREKIGEVTGTTPTMTAQPTSSGWWGKKTATPAAPVATKETVVSGAGCPYHDAAKLTASTAKDPVSNTKDEHKCQCAAGKGGKNLLMISGPDGFIEVLAGKKIWANGQELQGLIGGVVGDLTKKNPGFWRDWLVLKL